MASEDAKVKKFIEDTQFSIFRPVGAADLRQQWPSLNQYKEFSEISPRDLLFVWYYRCKSSDGRKLANDRERMVYALNMVYPNGVPVEIEKKYLNGMMPDKVKAACQIMGGLQPELRTIINRSYQNILLNFYKLSQVNLSSNDQFRDKDGNVDWTRRRAAADTIVSMAKAAEDILAKIEGRSLGVDDQQESAEDLMDRISAFHDQQILS